jgi:hypothetical protein
MEELCETCASCDRCHCRGTHRGAELPHKIGTPHAWTYIRSLRYSGLDINHHGRWIFNREWFEWREFSTQIGFYVNPFDRPCDQHNDNYPIGSPKFHWFRD